MNTIKMQYGYNRNTNNTNIIQIKYKYNTNTIQMQYKYNTNTIHIFTLQRNGNKYKSL